MPSSMRLFRTGEPQQVARRADAERRRARHQAPHEHHRPDDVRRVELDLRQARPRHEPGRPERPWPRAGRPSGPHVLRQRRSEHARSTTWARRRKQLDFTYDQRHQLTGAISTTSGYFTGNYAYSTGGRFTRATHAQTITPLPPGSELKPRDVNYRLRWRRSRAGHRADQRRRRPALCDLHLRRAGNQTTPDAIRRPANPGTSSTTAHDQLRRATKKLNDLVQGSEEYWYDGDGKRLAVVKRDAAGNRTELIWFIGDVEAHYDAAGAITHVYSHLSLGTPVARVDRTGNTSTSVEYQFHGLANNTLAAVAYDGTINASFSYAPFGEVIESTNGGAASLAITQKRRFNDKHEDTITQLSYYGFRYYDKTLSQWTQGDPLYRFEPERRPTEPRASNLYEFSRHNTLRYVDPDGREDGNEGAYYTLTTGEPFVSHKNETIGPLIYKTAKFLAWDVPKGAIKTVLMQTSCNGDPSRDNSQINSPLGIDPSTLALPRGGAGGSPDPRAGKPFTPATKKEIDRRNAETNGGHNVCVECGRPVVPAKKSEKGVTPPGNERQRDHIYPKSGGGPGTVDNGQVLCRDCNLKKSNQVPPSSPTQSSTNTSNTRVDDERDIQ